VDVGRKIDFAAWKLGVVKGTERKNVGVGGTVRGPGITLKGG